MKVTMSPIWVFLLMFLASMAYGWKGAFLTVLGFLVTIFVVYPIITILLIKVRNKK